MPIKRKSCSKGQIRNPKTGKCIKRKSNKGKNSNKDKKNSNKDKKNSNKGKKNSNKDKKSKKSKKGKKNSRGVAGTTWTSRDKINIIINYKVISINKLVEGGYELQEKNHTYKDSIKKFLEEDFINELFLYYSGPPITKNSSERPSIEIEPNLDIKITLNNYTLDKRIIRQERLKFLIQRSLNAHLEVWNEDRILLESGEVLILDDIDIDDIDIKINTSSVIS
jgi:hypothetical protein